MLETSPVFCHLAASRSLAALSHAGLLAYVLRVEAKSRQQ
jgi:hypothetical protein